MIKKREALASRFLVPTYIERRAWSVFYSLRVKWLRKRYGSYWLCVRHQNLYLTLLLACSWNVINVSIYAPCNFRRNRHRFFSLHWIPTCLSLFSALLNWTFPRYRIAPARDSTTFHVGRSIWRTRRTFSKFYIARETQGNFERRILTLAVLVSYYRHSVNVYNSIGFLILI